MNSVLNKKALLVVWIRLLSFGRMGALLSLFLSPVICTADWTDENDPAPSAKSIAAYAKGVAAFANGRQDAAIAHFNEAIELHPRMAEAFAGRGIAYANRADHDKAIADFSAVIQFNPKAHSGYLARGFQYYAKDDNAKAFADYDKAISLGCQNADVYAARGHLLCRLGDYAKGIADCKTAISIDTNNVMGYNNLAWALATCPDASLRDEKKALEYAKKACDLNGWKEPHLLGTLAAAYAGVGDFDLAVKWGKKCMESGLPEKEMPKAKKALKLYKQKKPYLEENKTLSVSKQR